MADLLFLNPSTAQTVAWLTNGTTIPSWTQLRTDPDFKIAAAADFNGDGKADLLFYNEYTGQTTTWPMKGTKHLSVATLATDPNWKVAEAPGFNFVGRRDLIWDIALLREKGPGVQIGT